jgi:hypothetical protein
MLFIAVLGLLAGQAAWSAEADEVTYEVVDPDGIYFGSGDHPKAPAVIAADDVYAQIPEYKKVIDDDLDDDDPEYHLLMKKATERFAKALRKVAKRDGYDMIGEIGAIRVSGDSKTKIPDATDELIEIVSRN